MANLTGPRPERVNTFPIDDTMLFKHYFDGDEVFQRLKPYYNGTQYRFEVPVDEFDSLRRFLREHGYVLTVVDSPTEFYVVVRQYSDHPDGIFKDSIRHESIEGHNCFLMKDRDAVESVVARGAARLSSKRFSVRPATLGDFATPST